MSAWRRMALTPEQFKQEESRLHDAIDGVAARLRFWAVAARRRRARVDYLQDRYEHWIKVGREGVAEWRAAEEAEDKALADQRRHQEADNEEGVRKAHQRLVEAREAKAKAKRKTKRAHRKASFFREAVDDASDGLQKAVARRKKQKRKLRILKRVHEELHDAQVQPSPGLTGDGNGRVIYDGRPCAAWLANEFQEARDRGLWGGVLVSGVRTSAQSTALCFGMCGAPSCSGTCAGVNSNHNCDDCHYPRGAGDVTDFIRCETASQILGNRYRNDLPRDLVHMSASGH